MLRVMSHALTAADAQQVTLLVLLNLSAACDCVGHDILVLHIDIGLTGTMLEWIRSFLSCRM